MSGSVSGLFNGGTSHASQAVVTAQIVLHPSTVLQYIEKHANNIQYPILGRLECLKFQYMGPSTVYCHTPGNYMAVIDTPTDRDRLGFSILKSRK